MDALQGGFPVTTRFEPAQYKTQFGVKIAVMQDPQRDTAKSRANAERLAKALKSANPMKALAQLEHKIIVDIPTPAKFTAYGKMGGVVSKGSPPQVAVLNHLEAGPSGTLDMAAATGFSGNACRDACYVLAQRGSIDLTYVKGGGLLATLIPKEQRKGPVKVDFSRAGRQAALEVKVLAYVRGCPSSTATIAKEAGIDDMAVTRCLKSLMAARVIVKERMSRTVVYRVVTA